MLAQLPIHERETIRAFIRKDRQERCAYLLSHPNRRQKFRDTFSPFRWLDERFARPIPASEAHTAEELVALLKRHGAGPRVWVISEYEPIDGREMGLEEAMNATWGRMMGTLLSCIPGKLAFFRDEEIRSERLLIHP